MSSLECLLPDEPASEGPIHFCNRSKILHQQNFEHFKIYPKKLRKSQHLTFKFKKEFSFLSVIIVLLRLSLLVWNFTRLKIFTPVLLVVLVTIRRSGATFWCFEASGRIFCSSSKGEMGAHFISFLAPSQLLVTLPVQFLHFWLIEKDNSNEFKNSFSVQSIYIRVCFSYFVLVCKRGVSV